MRCIISATNECHSSADRPSSLTRLPGIAQCPERDPEQDQVLDEELPGLSRERGKAAGTRLPDAWRRKEEAQGREEHPDCQSASEGGSPRREWASGDEDRDGDLDHAKHGRETSVAHEAIDPTHQGA